MKDKTLQHRNLLELKLKEFKMDIRHRTEGYFVFGKKEWDAYMYFVSKIFAYRLRNIKQPDLNKVIKHIKRNNNLSPTSEL